MIVPAVDCDVEGATIRNIIRYDEELIIAMEGGCGSWWSEGSLKPRMTVTCSSLTVGFGFLGGKQADATTTVLEKWRGAGTPLRITATAAGFVISDNEQFLVLPRSSR